MSVGEIVAARIRVLCKERRISINKLAAMSNLPHSSIDNIIQGRSNNPTLLTLMAVANAFNMTVSELLDVPALNMYFRDDIPGED